LNKVQLVITLNQDGSVTAAGPIDQKLMCYGMLELAKDAIRDFKPAGIIAAPPGVQLNQPTGS
jgi:hypothetical protein